MKLRKYGRSKSTTRMFLNCSAWVREKLWLCLTVTKREKDGEEVRMGKKENDRWKEERESEDRVTGRA